MSERLTDELRAVGDWCSPGLGKPIQDSESRFVPDELCPRAADEIERLSAELMDERRKNEQWRALIPEVIEQLDNVRGSYLSYSSRTTDQLDAIIAKLREASQ